MMILKVLSCDNCNVQHFSITRLGKRVTFMFQRCHQIIDHDRCSYNQMAFMVLSFGRLFGNSILS